MEGKDVVLLICPKNDCPFFGCQHHSPHKEIWKHEVSWCSGHKPLKNCPIDCLVMVKEGKDNEKQRG